MDAQYQSTHDNNGIVHFAAAGNGSTGVYYPASLPVVNAVGAINSKGVAASFSNFGPAMDFSAPGDSILVTDRTGTSGYSSGDYFMYVGATVVTCSDTSGNRCTFTVTVNGGGLTKGTLRDDFNRSDGPLPGSNKWVLIQNQPSAGSMSIVSNAIQATSSAGVNNFGGVVWDSLYGAGTEASLTVTQKSGNTGFTSIFMYARMTNKDYNTGTGYRMRYLEQSGPDYLQIQRVGPGYANSFDLASANREINPGD